MFEAKIYIVWRSSKGSKDIIAIFADRYAAAYNADKWKKEAEEQQHKINYRVQETIIYGSHYPIVCR